jgi:ferric-dicitrate binding protein FerR (iron transport regulator)
MRNSGRSIESGRLRWKANTCPRGCAQRGLAPRRADGIAVQTVGLSAAAALVIVAVGEAMVWPRGVRVYAAGNDGLQVTLADDSRVEMRAHAEMTVGRASDGIQIDLKTGDIIVSAASSVTGTCMCGRRT